MSVFSIGALVGALLSGLLSDLAGRKVTLIAGASLYALGGTLQTSSFFLWLVYMLHFVHMWSIASQASTSGHACLGRVNFNLFQTCFSRMLFPARIISGIGTGYVHTRLLLMRLRLSQITIGGWFCLC